MNVNRDKDCTRLRSGLSAQSEFGRVAKNLSRRLNHHRPGIQADALEWLDKLAPPSWREPDGDVAEALLPNPGDYRHHRGGEDNGDAHFKNLLVHHQVIVPVTDGRLDLGPWQQVFYCEFDGRRPKRLVIKVLGE